MRTGNVKPGELFINVFLGGLILITLWRVILSKNSQTPAVLNAAGGAVSQSLSGAGGTA